eukprot:TRINITY_DN19106_c0_g1_i1.p1 TRINITY_DN19106_c0_g1~~TRINITY_DN19106_c0_g1_i1.p1  ORF type:complete len:140 (-),score=18.52 TRINITY_DN19106_c0_g1_i1:90-509(-)
MSASTRRRREGRARSVPGGSSDGGSRRSEGGHSRGSGASKSSVTDQVPADVLGIAAFDIVDRSLLAVRPHGRRDGRLPMLKFEPQRVKAKWVPGSESLVEQKPVFYVADKPSGEPPLRRTISGTLTHTGEWGVRGLVGF